VVTDPAAIRRVQDALADQTVIIADGHHRYETALAYRDEQRGNAAAEYVLAYLANMEEEGVVILPTHRLVRGALPIDAAVFEERVRSSFSVVPMPEEVHRAAGEIDAILPDRRLRLRPLAAGRAMLSGLPPEIRDLEVALLRAAILEPVLGLDAEALDFTHDDDEAIEAVTAGRAGAAFLLNPPSLAQVRAVCLAGQVMPEKSTYFYPKLATGLVLAQVGPPWP
jgi:uncharacterized protein (DUF1015 family)